uniref:Ion transport domain-containing protein n=1 Tax=Cryptomonas curvata TaxID=233186 RepID=A0A6T8D018_9CRYP|mmetsp:Transcript_56412/g.117924  ORF Transcript_56412/g.117924 Transcript_56412/m.117924 type:complete len:1794 (+) Transcript_56412:108-5489(+)
MSSEVPSVTTQRSSEVIQIPAGIDVLSVGKKREQKGSEVSSENKSQLSRSCDAQGITKLFGVQPLNLDSKKRTASECQTTSVFEAVNWTAVLASLQREKRLAIARKEEHYVNRSLFYFTSSSKLREKVIKLVEWPVFDKIILFLIAVNCAILIFDDPICRCASSDQCVPWDYYQQSFYSWDCSAWKTTKAVLSASENLFTSLFAAEMVLKIFARGFVMHKHAYLRDPWNWLDFVVVVASLLSTMSEINISILRTFRVLRPLRTLSRIKSMKPLLLTFARSLGSISNVFALLAFFMVIFSILAIELMSGSLRGYCYFDPRPGRNAFTPSALSRLTSQQTPFLAEHFNVLGGWNVYVQSCRPDNDTSFGVPSGFTCPKMAIDGVVYNTTCSTKKWCGGGWCDNDWNGNPWDDGGGYISYDNIGSALLTNFQCLTLAAWDDVLYRTSNGSNLWLSRLYHTAWVFIGAFVVVQLALAVLAEAFVLAQEEQRTERAREALHDESVLQIRMPDALNVETIGTRRRFSTFSAVPSILRKDSRSYFSFVSAFKVDLPIPHFITRAWERARRVSRTIVQNLHFQRSMTVVILLNTLFLALDYHDQSLFESSICRRRCEIDQNIPSSAVSNCVGPLFNRSWTFDGQGGGKRQSQNLFCFLENDAAISFPTSSIYSGGTNCSTFKEIDDCNEQTMCGWMDNKCKLGLYTATTFAANTSGSVSSSRITFRDLCGGLNEIPKKCPNYPPRLSDGLEVANYVFTLIFVVELILKLMALGIYSPSDSGVVGYFAESFNWVDFAIVLASAIDSILTISQGSNNGALSSLRALRILRMIRLVRGWEGMQKVLRTLIFALASLGPLCILISLFIYIFALLGMQLFGGKFRFSKTDLPRTNFDSFFPSRAGHGAFLAIFQILSTENWNNIMYCGLVGFQMSPMYAPFFIVVMLIGNYMFMNLFISILLQGIGQDNLDLDTPGPADKENSDLTRSSSRATILVQAAFRFLDGRSARVAPTSRNQQAEANQDSMDNSQSDYIVAGEVQFRGRALPFTVPDHTSFFVMGTKNPVRVAAAVIVRNYAVEMFILLLILVSSVTLMIERPDDVILSDDSNCPSPPSFLNCSGLAAVLGQTAEINCPRKESPLFGKIYQPCDSAMKNDVPPCCAIKSKMTVLGVLDKIFTLIFFCEMVLKIVSDGLILHPAAYLRDAWNWLDFVVVVISMMAAFGNSTSKNFKYLRTLRALRPLRVIKRNPGLKIAVNALLKSLPEMGNVSLVALFWLGMYALLGVQLFKGKFYKCYDYSTQFFHGAPIFPLSNNLFSPTAKFSGPTSVPSILECVSADGGSGNPAWTNRPFCFDNIFRAMLVLFEMMTTSGWMEMLQSMVDSTAVGVMQLPNANPLNAFYGLVHLFVGNWVLVNLVVGTVLSTYIRQKQANNGINPYMSVEEKQWKEIQVLMSLLKPKHRAPEHSSKFRRAILEMVQGTGFDMAVKGIIILSVVVQMVKTHDQDAQTSVSLFWINTVIAALFWIEAGCNLAAYGVRFYFAASLNQFDFFICVLSLIRLLLDAAAGEYDASRVSDTANTPSGLLQRVLHAVCVVRAFRLLRFTKGLRQMINTIALSVSSISNLGGLTLLILIIVSMLGHNLFYNVNLAQDPYQRMGAYGIPDGLPNGALYASYKTFDNTLWLVFRMTTGDFWNGLMYYTSGMFEVDDSYQRCEKAYGDFLGEGCGGPTISVLFHVLWMVFGQYTLMQLFSAVILENFGELSRGNRGYHVVLDLLSCLKSSAFSFIVFNVIWKEFHVVVSTSIFCYYAEL